MICCLCISSTVHCGMWRRDVSNACPRPPRGADMAVAVAVVTVVVGTAAAVVMAVGAVTDAA